MFKDSADLALILPLIVSVDYKVGVVSASQELSLRRGVKSQKSSDKFTLPIFPVYVLFIILRINEVQSPKINWDTDTHMFQSSLDGRIYIIGSPNDVNQPRLVISLEQNENNWPLQHIANLQNVGTAN